MKSCKTCKWWITPQQLEPNRPQYRVWGECELLGRNGEGNPRTAPNTPGSYYGAWHEPRLAETYGTGGSSDAGLRTKPEFGCVQHEEM